MRALGITLLVLIGGFAGLCSAGFTLTALGSSSGVGIVLPFAGLGFLIALGCYAGIRALARPRGKPMLPEPPDDPPQQP